MQQERSFRRLRMPDGSVADRVFAIEQEFGFGLTLSDAAQEKAVSQGLLYRAMSNKTIHQYTSYGSREYPDMGHPEYAQAEQIDFRKGALDFLRGSMLTAQRFKNYVGKKCFIGETLVLPGDVQLYANTCDPFGNSWGRHLNLQVPRGIGAEEYVRTKAAHRASRIVWAGAGYIAKKGSSGYTFELSEKAPFIEVMAGVDTMHTRSLVNLRDEPHANATKYRRDHDIAGESVCMPEMVALDAASGSIIWRGIEAGVDFSDLHLSDPVLAMKQISADPTLRVAVERKQGGTIIALDLQQALAERAIAGAITAENITDQELVWGQTWLSVLDRLRTDPDSCITLVGWVLKRQFIENRLGRDENKIYKPYDAAWRFATELHALLPRYGAGMQLLLKGTLEGSPDPSFWKQPPQAPETRAKIRGLIVNRLHCEGVDDYRVNWSEFEVPITANRKVTLALSEPLATDETIIDSFFEQLYAARQQRHIYDDLLLEAAE